MLTTVPRPWPAGGHGGRPVPLPPDGDGRAGRRLARHRLRGHPGGSAHRQPDQHGAGRAVRSGTHLAPAVYRLSQSGVRLLGASLDSGIFTKVLSCFL